MRWGGVCDAAHQRDELTLRKDRNGVVRDLEKQLVFPHHLQEDEGEHESPETPHDARAIKHDDEPRQSHTHEASECLTVPVVAAVVHKEKLVLAELPWYGLAAIQGLDVMPLTVEHEEEAKRDSQGVNQDEDQSIRYQSTVIGGIAGLCELSHEPRGSVLKIQTVKDAEEGQRRGGQHTKSNELTPINRGTSLFWETDRGEELDHNDDGDWPERSE